MTEPLVEIVRSPLAHAVLTLTVGMKVVDSAVPLTLVIMGNGTAECAVAFSSVHVMVGATEAVEITEHAVPDSQMLRCMWYWPATLQAPAEAAQSVAVEIDPV
jgi:hypothetical protein